MHENTRIFRFSAPRPAQRSDGHGPNLKSARFMASPCANAQLSRRYQYQPMLPHDMLVAFKRKRSFPPPAA